MQPVWEKWPCKGQPQAGGSEYLELHDAFSSTLHAPGAGLLSKVWLPRLSRGDRARRCFCCGGCLFSGWALRAGTGLQRWGPEDGGLIAGCSREESSSLQAGCAT